jgi:hypothetical protein
MAGWPDPFLSTYLSRGRSSPLDLPRVVEELVHAHPKEAAPFEAGMRAFRARAREADGAGLVLAAYTARAVALNAVPDATVRALIAMRGSLSAPTTARLWLLETQDRDRACDLVTAWAHFFAPLGEGASAPFVVGRDHLLSCLLDELAPSDMARFFRFAYNAEDAAWACMPIVARVPSLAGLGGMRTRDGVPIATDAARREGCEDLAAILARSENLCPGDG